MPALAAKRTGGWNWVRTQTYSEGTERTREVPNGFPYGASCELSETAQNSSSQNWPTRSRPKLWCGSSFTSL